MMDLGALSLFYLLFSGADAALGEETAVYSEAWELQETEELVAFVQAALREVERRGRPRGIVTVPVPEKVRITRTLRIFIGDKELKIRPMAKTILLLFLAHPEGIVLKEMGLYRQELLGLYRRVMRSSDPAAARLRVQRLLDIFNNEVNVNIARVNSALDALVRQELRPLYRIQGQAGKPKSLPLDRSWVVWDR